MKSVLLSIKPKYCELIASGKKTIEVRKTRPKLETPFKCYIYCTKEELLTKSHNTNKLYRTMNRYKNVLEKRGNITYSGKVIGEFVCSKIDIYDDDTIHSFSQEDYARWNDFELKKACIHPENFEQYANGNWLCGWHISDLVIYDEPKELSEFSNKSSVFEFCKDGEIRYSGMNRPPQSWCYVEGMECT